MAARNGQLEPSALHVAAGKAGEEIKRTLLTYNQQSASSPRSALVPSTTTTSAPSASPPLLILRAEPRRTVLRSSSTLCTALLPARHQSFGLSLSKHLVLGRLAEGCVRSVMRF